MEEQKYGRRKEDKLRKAKTDQGLLQSLYSDLVPFEKEDGSYDLKKKFSWKKTVLSSIAGLLVSSLLTWGVWVTDSVYTHNTREEVVAEQMDIMQKAVAFEIEERKLAINEVAADQDNDRKVLHTRISKLDSEVTSRLNGLDTKIESTRLSIAEKVSNTKEVLSFKMDRQTELMMRLLQQAYGIEIEEPSSGE